MTRLVLNENTTEEYIERLGDRLGWRLVQRLAAAELRPRELIWLASDTTAVHYLDNHLIGVQYLQVDGAEDADLVARLRSLLAVPSVESLVLEAVMSNSSTAAIGAIRRLAIGCSDRPHAGALSVFQAAFQDTDPAVRSAAVFATTFVGWPQFEPDLVALARKDSNVRVRELAQRTVEALRRHYW